MTANVKTGQIATVTKGGQLNIQYKQINKEDTATLCILGYVHTVSPNLIICASVSVYLFAYCISLK